MLNKRKLFQTIQVTKFLRTLFFKDFNDLNVIKDFIEKLQIFPEKFGDFHTQLLTYESRACGDCD